MGYYTSSDAGGTQVINATTSAVLKTAWSGTSAVTYYAGWRNYAVTLDPWGGTVTASYNNTTASASGASQTLVLYATKGLTTLYYKTGTGTTTTEDDVCYEVTPLTTTKTGATPTHLGYYTQAAEGGTQVINASTASTLKTAWSGTSSATYYAQWYDAITLKAVAVGSTKAKVTVNYNSTSFTSNDDADVTIYARYGSNKLYYKSGSTFYEITSITNAKTGYTFRGWSTTSGGTTYLITNAGALNASIGSYTNASNQWNLAVTGVTTVYAKWTANNYNYVVTVKQYVTSPATVTVTANGENKTANTSGATQLTFSIPFDTTFTPSTKFDFITTGKSYNLVWGETTSTTAMTAGTSYNGTSVTMGTGGATATVTLTELFSYTVTVDFNVTNGATLSVVANGETKTATGDATLSYTFKYGTTFTPTAKFTTSTSGAKYNLV